MPVFKDSARGTFFVKTYYTDYTGARKQKMKRGFKLQRDAKEWERSFLEKVQGTPTMTFQTLYDLYIEDASHRLRENSVNGKKNVFKNKILPYFKDRPINQIQPKDIRAWQNEMIAAGYSDAYLDRMQNMVTTIFNFAVNFYNLPVNPCNKAGHMGKRTRSMKFWTDEEYKRFIALIDDPIAHIAFQVLFYSGMRFGELLALTLSDVDFEHKTINIDKSYQHNSKGGILTPPKTDNGIRVVTMPDTIMEELQQYVNRLYEPAPSDRLFLFTKTFISNAIKRNCEAANVPYIRIHDLRHSHVSLLINMGFSPHLIAERIGDTVQMVNNTYGHLYPTRHQEVAEKLNELISL